MKKDRFEHHCLEAEAGRDTFVRHPSSGEEGMVVECSIQSGRWWLKPLIIIDVVGIIESVRI